MHAIGAQGLELEHAMEMGHRYGHEVGYNRISLKIGALIGAIGASSFNWCD